MRSLRFEIYLKIILSLVLGWASSVWGEPKKLVYVYPSDGGAYEWSSEKEWKKIDLSSFLSSLEINDSVQEYPWGKIRLTADQRVERWNGNRWEDSGIRPPPPGIEYKRVVLEPKGGILVELGGQGTGFNYILPSGTVIVARSVLWNGEAPPSLSQIIPYGNKGGFIGLDSDGKVWHITPPENQREFLAMPLPSLNQAEQLLVVDGTPILKRKSGDYRIIKNFGKTETLEMPVPEPNKTGTMVVLDNEGHKQLTEILKALPNRGPPQAKVESAKELNPSSQEMLPRYHITYEQFEDLLKQKVGQIQKMDGLWRHNKQELAKPERERNFTVLFGGGRLRGLLRWIDDKLISGISLDKIRKMNPPTLENLAPQPNTDFDVITLGSNDEKEIIGWDALSEPFYRASIAMGGGSLEKVFVSPDQISDPYGALRDFANGELTYIAIREEDYRKASKKQDVLWGNSRVAQALRYLRLLKEFPNHHPEEKSERYIKSLVRSNDSFLLPKKKNDWWIYKGLLRLFGAHRDNPGEFMSVLKKWNLYDLFVERGFSTDAKYQIISPDDIRKMKLRETGWLVSDLKGLENFLALHSVGRRIAIKSQFLPHAKSFREMAEILSFGVEQPSDEYIRRINGLLTLTLPEIQISEGGLDDFERAAKFATTEKSVTLLRKLAVPFIASVEDFITVLQIRSANPSDNDKLGDEWLVEHLDDLMKHKPTIEQLESIERDFTSEVSSAVAIKRAGLKIAKTPKEIETILSFQLKNPSHEFREAVDLLLRENSGSLAEKMDFEELKRVRDKCSYDPQTVQRLSQLLLNKATTWNQYASLVHFDPKWSAEQRERMTQEFIENSEKEIQRFKPSLDELEKLRKETGSLRVAVLEADMRLNQVNGAEDYFRVMKETGIFTQWDSLNEGNKSYFTNKFFSLQPNPIHQFEFVLNTHQSGDPSLHEPLRAMTENLKTAKDWDDFFRLTIPRITQSELMSFIMDNSKVFHQNTISHETMDYVLGTMNFFNRIKLLRLLPKGTKYSNAGSVVSACAWLLGKIKTN